MNKIIKAQPGHKLNIPDSLQSHAESTGVKAYIPAEIIKEKKDEEHQAWLEELRKGLEANTENYRNGLPTYFLTGKQAEDYDKQLKQMQQVYDNTDAFDIGDDVNAAYITAGKRPDSAYDVARYNQFQADAADTNIKGLTAVLFGADAAAMGLIPALAGWTAGDFTSKYGSEALGKVGKWMDLRMGDPDSHAWETAGNIGGSLAGWLGGYNAAHKLLKPAAWTTLTLTKGRMPNILMSTNYKKELINHALNNNWLKFEPYKPTNVSGQLSLAYKNGGILKGQRGLKPILKSAKAIKETDAALTKPLSKQSIAGRVNYNTGEIKQMYFPVRDNSRMYWSKLREKFGDRKLTAKENLELLNSNEAKNIFKNWQDLLGIERNYSTKYYPNTVFDQNRTIQNGSNYSPQIKAMMVKRIENVNKALSQFEKENGVITKIGPDGKPFKIIPKGFSYPSSKIENESLPKSIYMDSAIDDIGEYVIVNGNKLHYKSGGKIHIKKENRGKFTSYCGGKVTNECIARGKNSPNPAIRKRATFAANSRSWSKKRKHANGGNISNWFKHD